MHAGGEMGYQIQLAPDVEAWLAAMRIRDPASASRIDQAVADLAAGGDGVGPPLVVRLEDEASHHGPTSSSAHIGLTPISGNWDRRRADLSRRTVRPSHSFRRPLTRVSWRGTVRRLDAAQEQYRATLVLVRRAVATAATLRHQLDLKAKALEEQVDDPARKNKSTSEHIVDPIAAQGQTSADVYEQRLIDWRHQYAHAQARELRLNLASRELQSALDAFRTARDDIETAYAAVEKAAGDAKAEVTDNSRPAVPEGGATPDTDSNDGTAQAEPLLNELRVGTGDSADIRLLFTVTPDGAAVFLAAGMQNDWLRSWYREASVESRIRFRALGLHDDSRTH
jgi:hypothetical protein